VAVLPAQRGVPSQGRKDFTGLGDTCPTSQTVKNDSTAGQIFPEECVWVRNLRGKSNYQHWHRRALDSPQAQRPLAFIFLDLFREFEILGGPWCFYLSLNVNLNALVSRHMHFFLI